VHPAPEEAADDEHVADDDLAASEEAPGPPSSLMEPHPAPVESEEPAAQEDADLQAAAPPTPAKESAVQDSAAQETPLSPTRRRLKCPQGHLLEQIDVTEAWKCAGPCGRNSSQIDSAPFRSPVGQYYLCSSCYQFAAAVAAEETPAPSEVGTEASLSPERVRWMVTEEPKECAELVAKTEVEQLNLELAEARRLIEAMQADGANSRNVSPERRKSASEEEVDRLQKLLPESDEAF